MQLYHFLLFVFEQDLINNQNSLELFYSVFQEVALNFDLKKKEERIAKEIELEKCENWKVKEEKQKLD